MNNRKEKYGQHESIYSDFAYDDAFRTASYGVIIALIHKVAYKMTVKRENVQRKVGDLMGGKVLDLEIIRARNEGIAEGISLGKAEGITLGEARGEAQGKEKSISKLAGFYMKQDTEITREKALQMAREILD